jgi:hypothetical protein
MVDPASQNGIPLAKIKGASRFDLLENYEEFMRLRGFDIRGELAVVRSTVPDLRDNRDPQRLGEALLQRPDGMKITEWADYLERAR